MYKVVRFFDDLVDRLLVFAFLLVLLIGVYFIYDTAYVYYNASAARVAFQRPGAVAEEGDEPVRPFTKDYVAWLSLDDNEIDYPVMQGVDNNQYLNTNPYGDYSLAGSIFLDNRCSRDFTDAYSLLYGHHMSNNLMFGALDHFYDRAYFDSHTSGSLTVGETEYPLQIFAMIATDASEQTIFQPEYGFDVLSFARENSLYYREPVSERVVALSTCVDAANTRRTVVLCAMGEPTAVTETESGGITEET